MENRPEGEIKSGWIRYYAAPLLLFLIAAQQLVFVYSLGLTRWRGGGFGMYSEFGTGKTQVQIEFPSGNFGVSDETIGRVTSRLQRFSSAERRRSACRDLEKIAMAPVDASVRTLSYDLESGELTATRVFKYP